MTLRRATLRSKSGHAQIVADALCPDNTTEMTTVVEDETIETVIERETTGGLRTTADDYVTNLTVAVQLTNKVVNNHE